MIKVTVFIDPELQHSYIARDMYEARVTAEEIAVEGFHAVEDGKHCIYPPHRINRISWENEDEKDN